MFIFDFQPANPPDRSFTRQVKYKKKTPGKPRFIHRAGKKISNNHHAGPPDKFHRVADAGFFLLLHAIVHTPFS